MKQLRTLKVNCHWFLQIIALCMLIWSSASQATLIFDNGGFDSTLQTNVRNTVGSQLLFDDFTVADDFIITGFEWMQHDHSNMIYGGTRITLYDGLPELANLVFSSDVVGGRVLNSTPVFFDNWIGYDYTIDGLSIALDAGNYFLGLNTITTNSVFGDSSWDQTAGNANTIPGRRVVNSLNPEPGLLLEQDSVFKVTGSVSVPEPSIFWLFSTGLLGLIGLTRLKVNA